MSLSDEIKEAIVRYYEPEVPVTKGDWKRVSKGKLPSGETIRTFTNTKLNRTIFSVGEDDDAIYGLVELDQWIYGVYRNEDDELTLAFEPEDRFLRRGHVYDQHQGHVLSELFGLPASLDEVAENMFVDDGAHDDLTIHMVLKRCGFKHSQALTAFLNDPSKPVATRPAQAPTNPPLPPALQTNQPPAPPAPSKAPQGVRVANKLPGNVAAQAAATQASQAQAMMNQITQVLGGLGASSVTIGGTTIPVPQRHQAPAKRSRSTTANALGGYMNTGLEADGSAKPSDFLATVCDDDGEVLVMFAPMLDFANDGGFDQSMGPLIDHLLPSDWVEVSEQSYQPGSLQIPEAYEMLKQAGFAMNWRDFKNQFKDHYQVYDVDAATHQANLQAIANPQTTMPQHHHNPVAAGAPAPQGYPELAGQMPEVQQALIDARQRGQLGLEQEGRWDDADELEDKWDKGLLGDQIDLERSHALWLLYEHHDVASGLAMPNFFGMDDVRLAEELHKILDLEDVDPDDGDEVITVIEDSRAYPAPYDLPVPAYVPPVPIVHAPQVQLTKAPPKPQKQVARGPSMGTITGSGSFTPITAPTVAQDEDEDPADARPIRHDAGEQFEEFCAEVWSDFKAHGAGAIQWYDRFRPRFAQIIGLGYRFDRVEYTGIRVRMGYLNHKFEIVQEINVPDEVFADLFKDLGGDWNDDDNVQFINKRGGVDENGFTFSSSGLWAEVEPLIKGAGWLEARS